jgi:hypothetical protein
MCQIHSNQLPMTYAAEPCSWDVERKDDEAVLVRVHSIDRRLPDAVFTFRRGDPQYDYWQRQLSDSASDAAVDATPRVVQQVL